MSFKRKTIRNILRNECEEKGGDFKAFHRAWELRQAKKYGAKRRVINEAKGTHKKKTWATRIELAENY